MMARDGSGAASAGIEIEVVVIGNRPAGELEPQARILQVMRRWIHSWETRRRCNARRRMRMFLCLLAGRQLRLEAAAPEEGLIRFRNGLIATGGTRVETNSADVLALAGVGE